MKTAVLSPPTHPPTGVQTAIRVRLFLRDGLAPGGQSRSKNGVLVSNTPEEVSEMLSHVFSSPDNKHNITLSTNYDLILLRNSENFGPLSGVADRIGG